MPTVSPTIGQFALSSDTGSSSRDFVTNQNWQTLTATLSRALNANENVQFSPNGGSSWLTVTSYVNGTTITVPGLMLQPGNGQVVYFRMVTDGVPSQNAYGHTYLLDTTPPTGTLREIAISNDTGISQQDNVTNQASQTITATMSRFLDTDESVLGSTDGGASWTDVTASVTGTQLSWANATLVDGGSIKLKYVDLAGNEGPTATLAYTLDTVAPNMPGKPSLASTSDSGAVGDGITNVARPTIKGQAPANSIVTLYDTDGTTEIGSIHTGSSSSYQITPTTALADGVHHITARASDDAGNQSAATASLDVTIDTTPPNTPNAPTLAAGDETGAAGDGFTNHTGVTLGGNGASAGSYVVVLDNGMSTGAMAAANADGTYSITLGHLGDGTHSFSVGAIDVAFNQSGLSAPLVVKVDATAPTQAITGLALSDDTDVAGDFATSAASQTISATLGAALDANDRLMGSTDGGRTWADITSSVTGTSVAWATTLAGSDDIALRIADLAGNVGATTTQAYQIVADPVVTPMPPVTTPDPVTMPVVDQGPIAPTADPAPTMTTQTPAPTSSVFRFFDAAHGTQFLTSDAGERDAIIASRPDMSYEGQSMGSFGADASDANVAPVFRFFDQSNGTHFFTTSADERAQVLATRPDMTEERSDMFQHVEQRVGDVAVYRFFEKTDGSHFFTSNAGEIASITQGRPDMVAEGVAFYSPKV